MAKRELTGGKSDGARQRPAFIAWKSYQRRAEVLAPLLGCSTVRYFPHFFQSKLLRPFDYLLELIQTTSYLLRSRPRFAIIQAPPLFAALGAILTHTPYVVDIHNTLVQSFWQQIPFTETFIRRAEVLIAHNPEIALIIQEKYPAAKVIIISDPVVDIGKDIQPRETQELLFICSFDRDEPISLILDTIKALPDFTFTITANNHRLPRHLRQAFAACRNLRLTGFLSTEAYHSLLCSSKAAVVLCTLPAVQPSGAVEALASNTPLIVTRSSLTESLFGDWAELVDNNLESLTRAIRSLSDNPKDFQEFRSRWNEGVRCGVNALEKCLAESLGNRSQV